MKQVLFGADARKKLKEGVDILNRAVSGTLGASGRNVVYQRFGNPKVTNDGVTIARVISTDDKVQNVGMDIVKEASEKTNKDAGDGTTTSTVLAHAMITRGMEITDEGYNAMLLKKEITGAVDKVVETLKNSSIPVQTTEDLQMVAEVSCESKEIGDIVVDAIERAGIDGLVMVEESTRTKIEIEEVSGYKFNQGWMSPFFITDPAKGTAEYLDIPILVTDKKLSLNGELMPLLESMKSTGKNKLVIIADDVVGELAQTLVVNKIKGGFYTLIIKAPMSKRDDFIADVSAICGAIPITEQSGIKTITTGYLGKVSKIVSTDVDTVIIGSQDEVEVNKYLQLIKDQIANTEEDNDKKRLEERLAKLLGKIVIIKVGALSETDQRYLKAKIDDGVAATRSAQQEGIVAGGGVTLNQLASIADGLNTKGGDVVAYACRQPLRKIIENAGRDFIEVVKEITDKGGQAGYDALSDVVVDDIFKDGIIDPVKVTRCALENAGSVAGIFLTIDTAYVEFEEEKNGGIM